MICPPLVTGRRFYSISGAELSFLAANTKHFLSSLTFLLHECRDTLEISEGYSNPHSLHPTPCSQPFICFHILPLHSAVTMGLLWQPAWYLAFEQIQSTPPFPDKSALMGKMTWMVPWLWPCLFAWTDLNSQLLMSSDVSLLQDGCGER